MSIMSRLRNSAIEELSCYKYIGTHLSSSITGDFLPIYSFSVSLSPVSLYLASFEEINCHESYSCKKLNVANTMSGEADPPLVEYST